jgi:hypothetical protein
LVIERSSVGQKNIKVIASGGHRNVNAARGARGSIRIGSILSNELRNKTESNVLIWITGGADGDDFHVENVGRHAEFEQVGLLVVESTRNNLASSDVG